MNLRQIHQNESIRTYEMDSSIKIGMRQIIEHNKFTKISKGRFINSQNKFNTIPLI